MGWNPCPSKCEANGEKTYVTARKISKFAEIVGESA